jgi:hypothetical protein
MKSVKQQYIDLKEGKMTQAQFMRNVRMSLPQYVTNVTSFDDTVKILRNKAILTEADIKDKNQEKLEKYSQYTYTLNGKKVFPEIAFFNNILKAELDDTLYILSEPIDGVIELNPIKGKTGMYTEEMENPSKTYSVYELSSGQPYNFYNEEENKFIWSEPTKATLYTKEEAEMKRKELLQPRIDAYQRTGENYKEIHIGDLYEKNILREANTKSPLIINGKKVASYTQNGDKSYSVAYENGDIETIAVSNDIWDKINMLDEAGMGIKPMQTPEDKYGVNKKIDQSELNFLKKIYAKNPTEKIKKMIDDLEQRMSLNESYTTNTSGKELYSRFSEIDNLNGQEVLIGTDYELAKNNNLTKKEATRIVVKNLKKNPFYYTDTLMSGVEGYKAQYMNKFKPGSDQMRDVKSNDLVDKTNGMTSPKGVEKTKASSNKANKETNEPEAGIKLMSLIAKTVRGVKKMDATGEKMKKLSLKESARISDKIIDLADKIHKELVSMGPTDSKDKLSLITKYASNVKGDDLKDLNFLLYQKSAEEIHEYSTLPGGDNMTDVAGHQMDEAKASSLSVGDKFKIAADLGKFVMGEEVEVVSMEPFGNDIKLVLSNGKDKDDFYLDRNDEI